jgi:hypothetical protein
MAIFKNSMAHKVRGYMKLHPQATVKEVAEGLGIKSHHVHSTMWRDKKLGAPKRTYKKRAKASEVIQTIPEGKWTPIAIASSNTPINPPPPPPPMPAPTPEKDMVNSPEHYKVGGIEVIDFIKAKLTPEEFRGYLKGNVLKYTSRAGYKDDAAQDIGKLVWYASKLQDTHAT